MVDEDPGLLGPLRLWPSLLAVALGGAVGTLARYLVLQLPPMVSSDVVHRSWEHAVPWWLFAINTVGVFIAVIALAGPLRNHSPDDVRRLFVITGVLGGFTSYSTLIKDAYTFPGRQWWAALVLVSVAVALGVVAAFVGERVARWRWH